jgi:hypothetical protein
MHISCCDYFDSQNLGLFRGNFWRFLATKKMCRRLESEPYENDEISPNLITLPLSVDSRLASLGSGSSQNLA